MNKTQAMRQLDQFQIRYEVRTYPIDPSNLEATHVAELIGLDPFLVYKTLVVQGDSHAYYLALIPGPELLDLKRLARVAQEKSVSLVPVDRLEAITGYVRGGVSPFATKKRLPIYIKEGVEDLPLVSVSAGKRGMQILLAGTDLIRASQAVTAPIARQD